MPDEIHMEKARLQYSRRAGNPGSPIRVTMYAPRSDLSGSVLSFIALLNGLPRSEFDVQVLCQSRGPAADQIQAAGWPTYFVGQEERPSGRVRRKLRRGGVLLNTLLRLVVRRPEFLYLNTVAEPIPLRVAQLLRIPVVAHFRDSSAYLQATSRFTRARKRLIAEVPSLYLSCSRAAARELVAGGIAQERTVPIHNGIDPEYFRPDAVRRARVRRTLGYGREDLATVLVAGMRPEKGMDILLRAAALARTQIPSMHYLIVGGPLDCPYYRDVLLPLVSELGLEDRVRFMGFYDDVRGMLDAADIVAVPSSDEPFGRVNIEGMSMEKPIVATTVGGIPEIIEDGTTGFLIPPDDPGALAEKLIHLANDEERRRRMGTQGRRTVVTRFTEERYVGRVVESLIRFARDGGPQNAEEVISDVDLVKAAAIRR